METPENMQFTPIHPPLELGSLATDCRDLVVEERGQKVGVGLTSDLGSEVSGCNLVLVALTGLRRKLLGDLLEDLEVVLASHLLALLGDGAVLGPLPEL